MGLFYEMQIVIKANLAGEGLRQVVAISGTHKVQLEKLIF